MSPADTSTKRVVVEDREPHEARKHEQHRDDQEGLALPELVRERRQRYGAHDAGDEHHPHDHAALVHVEVLDLADLVDAGGDRVEDAQAEEEEQDHEEHVPVSEYMLEPIESEEPVLALGPCRRGRVLAQECGAGARRPRPR